MKNLAEIALAVRRIYTRRHRPRALIPILLIIVLTAAVGMLGYFKVSLVPRTPVPPLVD